MSATGSRLLTLADYEAAARARFEPPVWDYVAGGAGQERTLAANLGAFDEVRLRPRMLSGVCTPDTTATVLGRTWRIPVGIAPVAYHTLAHPEGEAATAGAAGTAGVPLVVSTFAGRPFKEIAAATSSPLWLQVYCFRDRSTTRGLVEAAGQAGFEALVLTVDAPRLGRRLRDVRNDFRLPPDIVPGNLPLDDFRSPSGHALTAFDPSLDWSAIGWLRSISSLPVLVKGVLTGADARRAVDAGADGIVVSNHGGRQLDGAPATLDVLPEIAAAADSCPVLLDGGVRRGTDVLAALALGADAVLVGRPVLHGLAVAGRQGVEDVLDILAGELTETMALTGTPSTREVGPALIHGSPEPAPAPLPVPAPEPASALRREQLHGSLSDPVLDTMTFLNEVTHRYPDAVSFAPGRPHDGFFDTADIVTYLNRYLGHLEAGGASPERIRSALYQYGPTAGQIRELVAESLRKDENIDVPPESIVVTVGAQEAMLLAVRALIAGPEDVLLVASPCYVGITGAARLLDVVPTPVDESPDGFRCADLEAAILRERGRGRRPRAFYVVPDHSNPSGATLSLRTRHELLDLAERHDLLILEDSPYRLVSPGEQLLTLKALDRSRRVVHLGSYAKSLFPGARVGFAVADQQVTGTDGSTGLLADELAKIKSMVTVNTPSISQAVVAGMLLTGGGRAAPLNTRSAAHYGDALRVTLEQLERRLPEAERSRLGIRWNRPGGGFFLGVQVPFRADDTALIRSAEQFGVIWTPMSYFYPQGGGERMIRLSVSYLTHEQITEGIGRLTRFIGAESAR